MDDLDDLNEFDFLVSDGNEDGDAISDVLCPRCGAPVVGLCRFCVKCGLALPTSIL